MASNIETPFLNFKIITNILTRLPIKSIVRFQCVCKEWKDLIKSQYFISQHTLHTAHQNPFLLIHAYDDNHHRSTLRLLNHNMQSHEVVNTSLIDSFKRDWTIIGSCNGLLCVELASQIWRRGPTSYLVWNPVSNEVREVPCFVNSDCRKSTNVGFGYSSVVDDYKIVRFYKQQMLRNKDVDNINAYEMSYGVQVFSLRSGSWKELHLGDLLRYIAICPRPAHVNGTIFWSEFGSPFERLIAFDIATEAFKIIQLDALSYVENALSVLEYRHRPHSVYEYGNKLAMACFAKNVVNEDVKGCDIFMRVIEEDAGESGKRYNCTERDKFGPVYGLLPLCFWRNQVVCQYEGNEGDEKNSLHLFNLISKELNKFPNFSGGYDHYAIFNYKKSLFTSLQHLG